MGTGQILVYPTSCANEVGSIAIMLLHTCGNSQHIRVKDNVERIHTNALYQNTICTFGYLYSTLIARGLSLFVEAHHHDSGAVAHAVLSMANENLLALLQ